MKTYVIGGRSMRADMAIALGLAMCSRPVMPVLEMAPEPPMLTPLEHMNEIDAMIAPRNRKERRAQKSRR